MTRLALIGLDSSHADHMIRLLNVEGRYEGVRIVALIDDDQVRAGTLAVAGGVDHVGSRLPPVFDTIDAAIVGHRAGSLHRDPAQQLLAAGIPVFVDKPLAASVADAEAIVAAAAQHRTVVASWSALRFAPDLAALHASVAHRRIEVISVTGSADAGSVYDGLAFYGIHLVEAALTLAARFGIEPDDRTTPAVVVDTTEIVATWAWSGTQVRVHFVRPVDGHPAGFAASVGAEAGGGSRDLRLDDDYLAPVIERFLGVLRGDVPPPGSDEMMRPVRMIASVQQALSA